MTIRRIAELAGVSGATVSKVLNGKDQYISEDTRKRIMEIVEREGYIPNGVAKSLRMKRTKTIGIIIPDVVNSFFSELARGAEDQAEIKGYSIILCNTDNKESKEKKYLKILQEKMVDGIIVAASENSKGRLNDNISIPIVLVDRDMKSNNKIGRITVDNEQGMYDATSFLIKKGCRKIGLISANKNNKPSLERAKGYERALLDNGIYIDEKKTFFRNYTIETGYEGAIKLIQQSEIDGIVCGNDLIAIGVIRALKEANIDVPSDVRVIGFDDITISKYMEPPLTTIKQPIYEIGQEFVNMLIDIIENKDINLEVVFKPELIERGSA